MSTKYSTLRPLRRVGLVSRRRAASRKKARRGESRQLPPLRNAQQLFQHPAGLPIADRPIGQRAEPASPSAQQIEPRQQPIAGPQAVGRHIGRLRFDHQLGNIDSGRTFQPALMAIDAQIGDRLSSRRLPASPDRICRPPRRGSNWPSPAAKLLRPGSRERSGTSAGRSIAPGRCRSRCSRGPWPPSPPGSNSNAFRAA